MGLRVEIIGEDNDPLIKQLWTQLEPLNKLNNGISVHMTFDGGFRRNKRALVLTVNTEEYYVSRMSDETEEEHMPEKNAEKRIVEKP